MGLVEIVKSVKGYDEGFDGIIELLDKNIIEEEAGKEEYFGSPYVRVTEVSYEACPRQVWLRIHQVPATNPVVYDPRLLRRFAIAALAHEMFQSRLVKCGLAKKEDIEKPIVNYGMKGKVDAIIRYQTEVLPVEFKYVGHKNFMFMEKSMTPRKHQKRQLVAELYMLRMSRGLLVCESEVSHDLLVIPVEYDEATVEEIKGYVASVGASEKSPPKVEMGGQCKGCAYYNYCVSNKGV